MCIIQNYNELIDAFLALTSSNTNVFEIRGYEMPLVMAVRVADTSSWPAEKYRIIGPSPTSWYDTVLAPTIF